MWCIYVILCRLYKNLQAFLLVFTHETCLKEKKKKKSQYTFSFLRRKLPTRPLQTKQRDKKQKKYTLLDTEDISEGKLSHENLCCRYSAELSFQKHQKLSPQLSNDKGQCCQIIFRQILLITWRVNQCALDCCYLVQLIYNNFISKYKLSTLHSAGYTIKTCYVQGFLDPLNYWHWQIISIGQKSTLACR